MFSYLSEKQECHLILTNYGCYSLEVPFEIDYHVAVENPWVRGRSSLFTALVISRCERRIGCWLGCPLRGGMRCKEFAIICCVLRPHHFPIASTKRARGRPRPG